MEPGDPFCGNCGYQLTGAVESARCPECGKPLVDVLRRVGEAQRLGRRYNSATRIFGLPLVSIAFGPHKNERVGKALGIIALGDIARGWIAFGGMSFGIFAFGGLASGVFALGGCAIGLFGLAGFAIGLIVALGGLAIGGVATGGCAIGYVAQGGLAVGAYARGGQPIGPNVLSPTTRDPEALRFFQAWRDYLGSGITDLALPLSVGAVAVCTAIILAAVIVIALKLHHKPLES